MTNLYKILKLFFAKTFVHLPRKLMSCPPYSLRNSKHRIFHKYSNQSDQILFVHLLLFFVKTIWLGFKICEDLEEYVCDLEFVKWCIEQITNWEKKITCFLIWKLLELALVKLSKRHINFGGQFEYRSKFPITFSEFFWKNRRQMNKQDLLVRKFRKNFRIWYLDIVKLIGEHLISFLGKIQKCF